MQHKIQLRISPAQAIDQQSIAKILAKKLEINLSELKGFEILKKSIDARQSPVKIQLQLNVFVNESFITYAKKDFRYENVKKKLPIAIVGAGPAGLFAALKLIELGYKPVIFERGKDIRRRRRDLAQLTKNHILSLDSNYCFGEGGAGTYSDGKLYTRSKKKGDVKNILELLVFQGADSDILIDAHPHIGTNKLPQIITNIRKTIENAGGEVNFDAKVVDFFEENGRITGLLLQNGKKVDTNAVILATGHSARDIYKMFAQKKWTLEAKTFAMGVRIEHPQTLIDKIQYKCEIRDELLPPSSYRLVHQVQGNKSFTKERGVYSFCMCPGGIIAPCATGPEQIVTNGWSPSRRNNPFANSGIVVTVEPEDYVHLKHFGVLAGMEYQAEIERKAWLAGGQTQVAPAQRMIDFVENRISKDLPPTSYIPGVKSVDLRKVLPPFMVYYLKNGLKAFGRKMKGYYTNQAVLVAVESRSSAPLRIPRNKESLQHPDVAGLYPCAEGAGYAGGIVSAAIDGIRCAEKVAEWIKVAEPQNIE